MGLRLDEHLKLLRGDPADVIDVAGEKQPLIGMRAENLRVLAQSFGTVLLGIDGDAEELCALVSELGVQLAHRFVLPAA